MKSLENFLSLGVHWTGLVEARPGFKEHCLQAEDLFEARAVKAVLGHMAQRLNGSRAAAGLTLSRPNLGDRLYKKSMVSAVLAQLGRAGVIRRVRAGRKGCTHEEIARTVFNPTLLAMATAWQSQHQANLTTGLRGAAALPARRMVKTPLDWTDPLANVEPVRVSKGQRPKLGIVSVQKMETAIEHAPRCPLGFRGIGF